MAALKKDRNKVVCISSVNDQPHARRPFASTHRAKVLQMPRALARTDRDHIRRAPVDGNLIDAAWLDYKLRRIDLDRERYFALLAIRDSFSSGSFAIPSGLAQVSLGLDREHLARPIAHGGRTVTWQLTWAGPILLSPAEICLIASPPPPP